MGLCLKTLPEAQQLGSTIYLNPHFHLVLLFIQNKELKTKWHHHETARKAMARSSERSASHCKSQAADWALPEGAAIKLSQDPAGFPWQKWREEWLWGGSVWPLWASVQRQQKLHGVFLYVEFARARMHMFEHAVFEKLLSWIINICLSVFSAIIFPLVSEVSCGREKLNLFIWSNLGFYKNILWGCKETQFEYRLNRRALNTYTNSIHI